MFIHNSEDTSFLCFKGTILNSLTFTPSVTEIVQSKKGIYISDLYEQFYEFLNLKLFSNFQLQNVRWVDKDILNLYNLKTKEY